SGWPARGALDASQRNANRALARRQGRGPRIVGMRLVRYATVGLANTLLTFVAFAVLTHAGVAATVASALAFAAGAMNGYALNRRWTFRTRGRFGRYVAVQALGAACSAAGIVIV